MKRAATWVIFAFSFLFLFTGCTARQSTSTEQPVSIAASISKVDSIKQPVYKVPLEEKSLMGILNVADHRIIHYSFGNNKCTYSEFDMTTGQDRTIGTVDFLVSNNNATTIGNRLYFYITTEGPTGRDTNLHEINLKTRTMKKVSSEKLYQTLVYMQSLDGHALSYKGVREGNIGTTFIDSFKPRTASKKQTLLNVDYDYSSKTGVMIRNFGSDDQWFYVLEEVLDKGSSTYRLSLYDKKGTFHTSYRMDAFEELFHDAGISNVKVMGRYLYLTNFSSQSIIGELIGDEVKPVLKSTIDSNLELAHDTTSSPADYYLFSKRGTERFFLLDVKQGDWLELPLTVDPNYRLAGYVVTDGQYQAAMILHNKEGSQKLFYANWLDFLPGAKRHPLDPQHVIDLDDP